MKRLSDIIDGGIIPFVNGTQTTITAVWTGAAPTITELKDGQVIHFWLPRASSTNVTLNLTLADGTTTGAIPCYYMNNTRLSTHYPAGSLITLIYRVNGLINGVAYTGWWAHSQYDTNTVYTHPIGDGNLHVPATGTSNNGKVLTAGATAGSLSWQTPSGGGAIPTCANYSFYDSMGVQYIDMSASNAVVGLWSDGFGGDYQLEFGGMPTSGEKTIFITLPGWATSISVGISPNSGGDLFGWKGGLIPLSSSAVLIKLTAMSSIYTAVSMELF